MRAVYLRAGGFPLLSIERVIRLPWSALCARPNINTTNTPAMPKSTPPIIRAFRVLKLEFSGAGSGGGGVVFAGPAAAGTTGLTGRATGTFVGFTVAKSGDGLVSTFVFALVSDAATVGGG